MKIKTLGQVFTPLWIVNKILDEVGYSGKGILDKNILEPSAGDGQFVVEIVRRYIFEARKKKWSNIEIINGIKKHIYAIELDHMHWKTLKRNINSLISKELNVNKSYTFPNITTRDSLFAKYEVLYEFIVGNPPYIRIHNLERDYVQKLRNEYNSCKKGNFDIYYAFYELGLSLLNEKGKLSYISPNSFMKTSSGKSLRKLFVEEDSLISIIDFESQKHFKNVMTYTSILTFNREIISKKFKFVHYKDPDFLLRNELKKEELKCSSWNFYVKEDSYILEEQKVRTKNLIELAEFKNGVATLWDSFFITDDFEIKKKKTKFNEVELETELIRDIIKISEFTKRKKRIVFFPYKKINGKYQPLTKKELNSYPLAKKYIEENKERLSSRSLDKKTPYWAFGRAQGLGDIDKSKQGIRTLIKNEVSFVNIKSGSLAYSGVYSTGKNKIVKEMLLKDDFLKYSRIMGSDKSGGYKNINTKVFKEYKYN